MEFKTYSRRPGSDDLGKDYEFKITALLALRCAALPDTENMWVGSNIDHVGDFDDVAICRKTTAGKYYAFLIQLKHQQNPKQILDRDFYAISNKDKKDSFSLAKYNHSFIGIQSRLKSSEESSDVINYLKKCDKIVPILFTNKPASQTDCLIPKFDDCFNFINTNIAEKATFQFNTKKFNFESDFLDYFVLFADQTHVSTVDRLLETEVQNLIGGVDNSKTIAQQFLKFITVWSKDKDNDVYYTLTKNDIVNKIVSLALERYVLNFSKDFFLPSNCEQDIFNKIIDSGERIICDFDDITFSFLKSYLASKIKKFVSLDNKRRWSDHLSNEQQHLFFSRYLNANTKTLNLKEKLGIFDVYQNLWLCNKVPLLITIDQEENYEKIKKMFECSRCSLNLILFKSTIFEITDKAAIFSLTHLQPNIQNQILSQYVKLQGRSKISLNLLLKDDLNNLVKIRDIIYILSGIYNLGISYEDLPQHFIEQKLSLVCIKNEVLDNLTNDLFLIENHNNFSMKEHSNCIAFDQEDDLTPFKLGKKNTHRLEYYNNFYFIWKNTFGNIQKIREYRNESIHFSINSGELIETLFPKDAWENYDSKVVNIHNSVHIISANPGMGKSMFLNFIASKISLDFWVLKITLLEFEKDIINVLNLEVEEQLRFFNKKLLLAGNCINLELSQQIFERFLTMKKVIILLDGFDEIAFMYKNEVTGMAKQYQAAGFFMWITTRPILKTHLENNFDTFSVAIKPFTFKDQERYLVQYFSAVLDPGKKINLLKEFVQTLLNSALENFNDSDYEFTGVPLQTKFLGEVFSKQYVSSLTKEVININQTFDLLYLYEEFSKGKTEILCQKYDSSAKRSRILFKKYQQLYAIDLAFPKRYTQDLNLDTILEDYSVNKIEEIRFLQREGVLVMEQNSGYKFNIKFVHLTFAEFLAAQWLSENIDNTNETIKILMKNLMQRRFQVENYNKFLFRMFDRILARNCPLHLAVINNRMDKADLSYANVLDQGGRSILHVIALYGAVNEKNSDSKESVDDKFIPLLHNVEENRADIRDKMLSYNPLDYAIKNFTLNIANKLCEKFNLTTSVDISLYEIGKYFTSCIKLSYRYLFHKLLFSWSSRQVLLNNVDKSTPFRSLCKLNITHPNFDKYLEEYGERKNVDDLFRIYDSHSPYYNYYNDIRFAVSFGEIADVNYVLSTQPNLNQVDVDNNTPLYYATTYQRHVHVKFLLSLGVEVNKTCRNGDSALHTAVKTGNLDIMVELLNNNADVNLLNHQKRTPIFNAVLYRRVEAVARLEEEGAILNLEDAEGNNLLHLAATVGYVNFLVSYLIKYPISINKQNKNGDTPLILATKNRETECITLLLSNGATCNKENLDGFTPLHYASQEGFHKIIQELLSHNCDINKQNKKLETPLLVAIKCQQKDAADLLLENGADCNLEDMDGYVPFHCAIRENWSELVVKMMLYGAEIKKKDLKSSTPLHVALEFNFPVIAQVLLNFGAEVNQKDCLGSTPLLYAIQIGQINICKQLLERGADLNCTNKFKHSALQIALRFHKTQIADLLISASVNWNTSDMFGDTSLMVASESGLISFVNYFISHGACVNNENKSGQTALHVACQNGRLDVVQELLGSSADIDKKDKDGKTPLMVCIEKKIFFCSDSYKPYISIITFLIENGANVNLQDGYGNTALHYVCVSKDKPFPLSKDDIQFVFDNFYNHIAIMLLENNVDTDLKNVEKKTALDLAEEANFENVLEIIQQYITIFQQN